MDKEKKLEKENIFTSCKEMLNLFTRLVMKKIFFKI